MASSSSNSTDTIMASNAHNDKLTDMEGTAGGATAGANSSTPKQKRLACEICRRRKLKCDGTKPSCSTCSRLGHVCAYDERRKKSGPKKGHLKALAEKLKQVEALVKTQEASRLAAEGTSIAPNIIDGGGPSQPSQHAAAAANFNVPDRSRGMATGGGMDQWQFHGDSASGGLDDFNLGNNLGLGMNSMGGDFTWEMIGLELEEPLPSQETIDELHQVYFDKIHPSLPMIHRARYFHAMNLAPNQRPPVCLRYAMWTLACAVTERFLGLKELFYRRARKYLELDTIKGFGEHMITVSHCQTHVLLASYEFKWMYFPRAWMSTGSAVRLCQMMDLHRVDGAGLQVKQCLPPARDWTEKEERRRTFWMAFCQDRYASIGTGWPMIIDEKDILTDLPASDEAYDLSRPEETQSLHDVTVNTGPGKLSSFGGVILLAYLFGRNLIHLHRPDQDDRDHDLNGEFWKRHRNMDNILLNVSLCIPSSLRLPQGLGNPNVVFTNMCIHTSTICLHQAAIFKAETNNLPASVGTECKMRCITSAHEIASIMKMASHLDLDRLNPFISFCLYVAARVFVQFLKSRPDDSQVADSLRFLLSAMNALKRKNPLTESFVVQLDVDLEALGAKVPKLKNAFCRSSDGSSRAHVNPGTGLGTQTTQDNIYRQECQFLRTVEDDGNPANAPNLVEPVDLNDPLVQLPGSSRNTASDWSSSAEQRNPIPPAGGQHGDGPARTDGLPFATSLHGMVPNNISLPPNYHAHPPLDRDTGGSSNGVPLSTPSPNSNQHTPNSSTSSSDHHQHMYHQMHQQPHHHPHHHQQGHGQGHGHGQAQGQGQGHGLAPNNNSSRHMSGSGGSSSMLFENNNNNSNNHNNSTSPVTPGSSSHPTTTTATTVPITVTTTTTTTATSTALDTNPDPAAAVGFFLDPTIFGMPGVGIAPGNRTNPALARTMSDGQQQPQRHHHHHHHHTGSDPNNNGTHGMGMNIGVGSGDGMTPDSVLQSIMAMGNMDGIEGIEACGMDLGWGDDGLTGGHGNGHGHGGHGHGGSL